MQKRLLLLATVLFASNRVFAQAPADHLPTANGQPAIVDVAPAGHPEDEGPWIISLGPAYNWHTTSFNIPDFNSTEPGFGGYIALERFITPPLSLRLEFSGTHSNARRLLAENDYLLDFGPRIYPLRFGKQQSRRIEPFLGGFVGGNFYDFTYTAQVGPNPPTFSSDPSLVAGAGGGLTIRLPGRWWITFEADYYRTLGDAAVRDSDGTKLHVHDSGVLITDGLSYRF